MTLKSVFVSQADYEVFIVDNASTDGSIEMVKKLFPKTRLIENKQNLGFAAANNQAIKQSKGSYVLLLNSDVQVSPDTFDTMLQFMDNNPTVAISGCRVERSDGSLDKACRRSFPTPWVSFTRFSGLQFLAPKSRVFARYNLTYLPEDETYEVDSVMGAFFMIRREVVNQVGLLDEDYFMYGEDIDWCYRVKAAGYKVMYVPITKVIHYKGSSSKKSSKRSLYEFHRAMQIFYDKHYRKKYSALARLIVIGGIWKVYALRVLINLFRSEKIVSK